jgi:diguanylate cyclase (GGDEF)-like protein
MKSVCDVMTRNVVHIGPEETVAAAVKLMKHHRVGGLPVVDGDRVVGIVTYLEILGADENLPVDQVMTTDVPRIPQDTSISTASRVFSETGAPALLVMDGERLAGIVTPIDLLSELGKTSDQLTGLPRANEMRDWSAELLGNGQEITILFIDLDAFGQFNKNHGHVVGDRALQHVARTLGSLVDDSCDMLCRYGGDEFVIATTRKAEESLALANRIVETLGESEDHDLPERVTAAIGVFGGKRTKEREGAHVQATVDDLVNLASKSCTLAKKLGCPVVYRGAAVSG